MILEEIKELLDKVSKYLKSGEFAKSYQLFLMIGKKKLNRQKNLHFRSK